MIETGGEGALFTEVAAQIDDADAWIARSLRRETRKRVVLAAVVNDQHFIIRKKGREHVGCLPHDGLDIGFLVVRGKYQRKFAVDHKSLLNWYVFFDNAIG